MNQEERTMNNEMMKHKNEQNEMEEYNKKKKK